MIVNDIDVQQPAQPLPKLPVARAVWVPCPNLATAAAAWIYAGGAHHTGFSQALTMEHMEDFSAMADVEFLCIDADTKLPEFRNELWWNDAAYLLKLRGNLSQFEVPAPTFIDFPQSPVIPLDLSVSGYPDS